MRGKYVGEKIFLYFLRKSSTCCFAGFTVCSTSPLDYVFFFNSFLIENIWCYLEEDQCVALVHTHTVLHKPTGIISICWKWSNTRKYSPTLTCSKTENFLLSRKLFKFSSSFFHPFNLLSKLTLINPPRFYLFILTIKLSVNKYLDDNRIILYVNMY